MCGLLHTWISIFDIAIPYLRPNKATNWNFLVPSGLFVTKAPCSSPFSPAQHNCWREESPNMWNTFLGQVIIFFYGLMRVIIKTEVRKMIFGHAVIAWIFFLIFYYCKILNFGLLKVRFRRKNKKMWKTTVLFLTRQSLSIKKIEFDIWHGGWPLLK